MISYTNQIINTLADDAFIWFLANHNKDNGLVLDRAFADGPNKDGEKSTAPFQKTYGNLVRIGQQALLMLLIGE